MTATDRPAFAHGLASAMSAKPERYVVYWPDWPLNERLAKDEGCDMNHVDPVRFEASKDFDRLEDARAFLASPAVAWDGSTSTIADVGGWIEERVSIVYDPRLGWDWAQERIEP